MILTGSGVWQRNGFAPVDRTSTCQSSDRNHLKICLYLRKTFSHLEPQQLPLLTKSHVCGACQKTTHTDSERCLGPLDFFTFGFIAALCWDENEKKTPQIFYSPIPPKNTTIQVKTTVLFVHFIHITLMNWLGKAHTCLMRCHSWQYVSEWKPSHQVEEGAACRAQRQDCPEAQIWRKLPKKKKKKISAEFKVQEKTVAAVPGADCSVNQCHDCYHVSSILDSSDQRILFFVVWESFKCLSGAGCLSVHCMHCAAVMPGSAHMYNSSTHSNQLVSKN